MGKGQKRQYLESRKRTKLEDCYEKKEQGKRKKPDKKKGEKEQKPENIQEWEG